MARRALRPFARHGLALAALSLALATPGASAGAQARPPAAYPAVALGERVAVVLGEASEAAGAVLWTVEPTDVVLERTVAHAATTRRGAPTRYTLVSHDGTCVGTAASAVVLEVALPEPGMTPALFEAVVIEGCALGPGFALALAGEHPSAGWARPERDGPSEDPRLEAPITGTIAGRAFRLRWRGADEVCVRGPTRLWVGGVHVRVPDRAPAMLRAGVALDGALLVALDFGEDRVRLAWIVGRRARDARTVRWPHALDYACECC